MPGIPVPVFTSHSPNDTVTPGELITWEEGEPPPPEPPDPDMLVVADVTTTTVVLEIYGALTGGEVQSRTLHRVGPFESEGEIPVDWEPDGGNLIEVLNIVAAGHTDEGLTEDRWYAYKTLATNDVGSTESNEARAETDPITDAPTADVIDANAVSFDSILVTIERGTGAQSRSIHGSDTDDFTASEGNKLDDLDLADTEYLEEGLDPGDTRYYKTLATNVIGSTESNEASATTPEELYFYAAGGNHGGSFARNTAAAQLDQDGLIDAVGVDELRDAHFVLGERTMLLEGEYEQRVLQSSDFGHSYWTKLEGSAALVDGVWAFTETTENSLHGFNSPQGVFVQTSDPALRYAVLKMGLRRYVRITESAGDGATPRNYGATFDLQEGTVVGAGSATEGSGILALGDGWYLCWVASRSDTSGSGARCVTIVGSAASHAAGSATYEGDDSAPAFLVRHAQGTMGFYPVAPILSSGSLVTKAADALDLAGVTWASQETTQYERFFDLAEQDWDETVDTETRTTPDALDVDRAYSHVVVAIGEKTLEEMQAIAGTD